MIMSQIFVIIAFIRICQGMPEYASMPEYPLIHGIITNICDIIIYKRGSLSVTDMGIQRH